MPCERLPASSYDVGMCGMFYGLNVSNILWMLTEQQFLPTLKAHTNKALE